MREFDQKILDRLNSIDRLNLGFYPTPIEELPRLRAALGVGPRILIKRDDYTGIGFGGNKVRKLEYVMAEALAGGAEVVITIGGEKSNHARMTAAICAKLGIECVLVLNRAASGTIPSGLKPASKFIDEVFGAEVHLVTTREERSQMAQSITARLNASGRRAVLIPLGASIPLGALGFVQAAQEAGSQLEQLGVQPNYIFHASSSAGTQAGLLAGRWLFGLERARLIGVSPDDPAGDIAAEVARIVEGVCERLELQPPQDWQGEIHVLDEYIGPGYGVDSVESVAALKLLAKTEGLLLDPVYTAKAMAGLIDQIRQGKIHENETVLFWHTGGQMALFFRPE